MVDSEKSNSDTFISKKKYKVLFESKRKGLPSITSDDNLMPNVCLHFADESFLSGQNDAAARYYCEVLKSEMESCMANNEAKDQNNNINHNNTSEWSEDYLEAKLMEATENIAVSITEPKGYLEKAAVLFFQDNWKEARKVLETGMQLCTSKTIFKDTITKMEQIEKITSM